MKVDTDIKRNLVAHYYDPQGNSDKVYIASIREVVNGNGMSEYEVIGKWGRRGGHLSEQRKAMVSTETEAQAEQQKLFRKKVAKGYVDIENPGYKGGMTISSVEKYLEVEGRGKGAKRAPKVQKVKRDPDEEIVVKCIDNKNLDDQFDIDQTYIAKAHPSDDEMLLVMNVYGKWCECLAKRFELSKEE